MFRRYNFRSITIVIINRLICSPNVKTLKLKTVRTIQLHTLKLPTLIVISELQITASKLFTWFNNNHIKANPEKNTFLWVPKLRAFFGGALEEWSSTEKLLGIQIDSVEHISSVCNKVGKKINVLSRLVNYKSFDNYRMVMKALIETHSHYYPLNMDVSFKNTEQ